MNNMAGYTKLLQFNKETQQLIYERDRMCLFCKQGYHMEGFNQNTLDCIIHDVMHFIPKSKMGLGIPENGVWGCRYHHHMLDNGKGGYRREMLKMMENYLKSIYPEWDKTKLVYRKWG